MRFPATAALLLIAGSAAASAFLDALHRADARDAVDEERIEFTTRAIRAWTPADGPALLAHAHFRRAEAEAARQDDAAAESDLTRTLELDAGNEKALLMRGRARLAIGRPARAEEDFSRYAAAVPEDGEGWLALGEARVARGLPHADKPAFKALKKAEELLGGDPRPLLAEGRAHLAASRLLPALDRFEAAVAQARDLRPDALSWRARARYLLRNAKGARQDLTEALPAFEARLEAARRSHASARSLETAKDDLAQIHLRRAQSEELLRLEEEAVEDYRQACELGQAAACARLQELLKKKPAPPRPAPPPRKKRKANPKNDSGERIYAS